jgi:pimeloyl-ACP methyl ester carboxylesterase
MLKIISSLLLLFAAFSGCAFAQQVPAAITTDPAPDKDFPAATEAPDIVSHGARLNAVFFIASGRGPHPVVLLLHGFPGNEKNLDVAYSLRRAGWNVLFPHYRGAWGSAGSFSFSGSIEDTQAAVAFLRDPENAKKFRTDPHRIVLIGHSMGGFMAANAAAHDPDITALCMISAWNIGAEMREPMNQRRKELFDGASSRLAGTTPQGLLDEAKANMAHWDYVDWAPLLKSRPVLVIESHDGTVADNKVFAETLRKTGSTQLTETYFETDHAYADHRIALQTAILNWLQSLAPPK